MHKFNFRDHALDMAERADAEHLHDIAAEFYRIAGLMEHDGRALICEQDRLRDPVAYGRALAAKRVRREEVAHA